MREFIVRITKPIAIAVRPRVRRHPGAPGQQGAPGHPRERHPVPPLRVHGGVVQRCIVNDLHTQS